MPTWLSSDCSNIVPGRMAEASDEAAAYESLHIAPTDAMPGSFEDLHNVELLETFPIHEDYTMKGGLGFQDSLADIACLFECPPNGQDDTSQPDYFQQVHCQTAAKCSPSASCSSEARCATLSATSEVEQAAVKSTRSEANVESCKRCVKNLEESRTVTVSKLPSMRWSLREDIFLSGIILDVYYRRHSLRPSIVEQAEARTKRLPVETIVWRRIQKRYDLACRRYEKLTKIKSSKRSIRALQKRWKLTGTGNKEALYKGKLMPRTKYLEKLWDQDYNAEEILTGPEEEFQRMFRQKKAQYVCT